MMLLMLLISSLNPAGVAEVVDPCLSSETWTMTSPSVKWVKDFHDYASGKQSHLHSLSLALKLKRLSQIMTSSELEEDFAEYWMGRVFYELKLDHLAHGAFTSTFENARQNDLKKAAFACLVRIQMRSPDWKAPDIRDAVLLGWKESDSDVLLAAQLKAQSRALEKVMKTDHRSLLRGFLDLGDRKFSDSISNFQTYFDQRGPTPSAFLVSYDDQARLSYGRALYSVARFKESADQFQKVKKKSNLEIEAMSNLAWAYLLQEKHQDAVGIALQLRTGALKQAFAPEPLMVAAMSLNELCDYPESIRMIQAFVKDYHQVNEWLVKMKPDFGYYAEVVNTIKGARSSPAKLSSEWIRSPSFLVRQKEINALIADPQRMKDFSVKMKDDLNREGSNFVKKANLLIKEVKIAQLKLKPGESLAPEYPARFFDLKKDLRKLTHLSHGFKTWLKISKRYGEITPQLRAQLVKKVNRDLHKRTLEIAKLLEKIKNNTDLIEVEIYNGASQDIVWKNANPEFEAMQANVKNQKPESESNHEWRWGRFPASELDNSEVWEDELGALKADVKDQCAQR